MTSREASSIGNPTSATTPAIAAATSLEPPRCRHRSCAVRRALPPMLRADRRCPAARSDVAATGMVRRHSASVESSAAAGGRASTLPSVIVAGTPGWTLKWQAAPCGAGSQSDCACTATRATPTSSSVTPCVRSDAGVPGHAGRLTVATTSTALRCARMLRTSSGPSPSSSASSTVNQRVADLPDRLEHERAGVVAARHHPRIRARGPHREAATSRIVEYREEEWGRIDPGPAEPCHVAVGIDERRGPRIREQRVLADRMLHASLLPTRPAVGSH